MSCPSAAGVASGHAGTVSATTCTGSATPPTVTVPSPAATPVISSDADDCPLVYDTDAPAVTTPPGEAVAGSVRGAQRSR
jgi:hypothetical protein